MLHKTERKKTKQTNKKKREDGEDVYDVHTIDNFCNKTVRNSESYFPRIVYTNENHDKLK